MAYFRDLSDYSYHHSEANRPETKNIGWLDRRFPFKTGTPDDGLLDLLFDFCSVSVAQMRGTHLCDLCMSSEDQTAERNGQILLLGAAEIRVFSNAEVIFAAPNFIFHYVQKHLYRPPDEFLICLPASPRPPDAEYFARLEALGLDWSKTPLLTEKRVRFRFDDLPG